MPLAASAYRLLRRVGAGVRRGPRQTVQSAPGAHRATPGLGGAAWRDSLPSLHMSVRAEIKPVGKEGEAAAELAQPLGWAPMASE